MISEELFVRINPSRYHFLKNILEGYDGLAIISSHDIKDGVIRLRYSQHNSALLFDLLRSVSAEIKQ